MANKAKNPSSKKTKVLSFEQKEKLMAKKSGKKAKKVVKPKAEPVAAPVEMTQDQKYIALQKAVAGKTLDKASFFRLCNGLNLGWGKTANSGSAYVNGINMYLPVSVAVIKKGDAYTLITEVDKAGTAFGVYMGTDKRLNSRDKFEKAALTGRYNAARNGDPFFWATNAEQGGKKDASVTMTIKNILNDKNLNEAQIRSMLDKATG